MENQIIINKFVDYLSVVEQETDINLLAVIVMSELEIEGFTLTTTKKLQKELSNILRSQSIVNCRNAIDNVSFKCNVKIDNNKYILNVIADEDKLTLDDFLELLDDKFGWDQEFTKHIKNIMNSGFYNAYFNSNECLNEQYAEQWLDNYKNKWNWRNK